MIPALARFAEALRVEGVTVSPAELLDAANAVALVGLEDRARFRASLRATLAKSTRARTAFDAVFDRFFVPPPRAPGEGKGRDRGAGGGGERPGRAADGAAGKRAVREENADRGRRPATSEDGREIVRRALRQEPGPAERRLGRLRRASLDGDQGRREPRGESERLMTRPFRLPATTEDERKLAALLPGILEAIRLREGRRMRRGRRGRLHVRRIFRDNLRTGGVPFVLPYRRPKRARARVVLLVDVSWSVARAAGFFLWMAASSLSLGRATRVLAFVDRPVDITEPLARWVSGRAGAAAPAPRPRRPRPGEGIVPRNLSFADLLEATPGLNLQAGSDYGRAFHALLSGRLRPTGRDTILVILGDGRTNRFEPLTWALQEIARRTRAVLWLVPEPQGRWGTGDSALAAYLPFVDLVVEAADLSGLARGLAALLRRL